MCLAVPGHVESIRDDNGTRMGRVNFGGVIKDVCLVYLPDIAARRSARLKNSASLKRGSPNSASRRRCSPRARARGFLMEDRTPSRRAQARGLKSR
jgi:hypothetical protein